MFGEGAPQKGVAACVDLYDIEASSTCCVVS